MGKTEKIEILKIFILLIPFKKVNEHEVLIKDQKNYKFNKFLLLFFLLKKMEVKLHSNEACLFSAIFVKYCQSSWHSCMIFFVKSVQNGK